MGEFAMNACKQTQALLFEKADGRTDPTVRAELEAHLAACPHCRQVFSAWTGAVSRLRALPIEEPSEVNLRRMENEVLRQTQVAPVRHGRRILWLALAAGLILTGGVGVLSLRATAPQPFARIQTLWGQVTLSGTAMTQGAAIGPGSVLAIASEGEASFVVGRATDVRLIGPGRVALDGDLSAPRLRLESGRLAVQIGHRQAGESFVVATAHGRVEVRGTRFVVGYAAQGSYVHVDEGEVAAFPEGAALPFAVKAGETFSLSMEPPPEPPSAPAEAPATAAEPRQCPKSNCVETGARVRKAMRVGNPARALELVDAAWNQTAGCPPETRCLDELGYLRAEALRQGGRIEGAIAAYRSLNRPGATRAMRQNALYAEALLERQLGRKTDARQSLEHAFLANPDGALAEEALAVLLDLVDPGSADARSTAERYLSRYPQGMAAARARRILADAPSSR
jgi:ferric-dicitrate binding protein FerR (iron transport regulator)